MQNAAFPAFRAKYGIRSRILRAQSGSQPENHGIPARCRILPLQISATHAPAKCRQIPPGLHRLDARSGLPADVPDALLRFLAYSPGAPKPLFYVLAAGGNLSGTAVFVPGGDVVCAGDGKTLAEGSAGRANRAHDDSAWRGDLRLRHALPPARIRSLVGLGAQKRSAASGRAEHHRPVDDADGRCLLAGAGGAARPTDTASLGADLRGHRLADFPGEPAAVDDMASDLASVADRDVCRWGTQPGRSASRAFPRVSVDGLRVRRPGCGIHPAEYVGARAGGESICLSGAGRRRTD